MNLSFKKLRRGATVVGGSMLGLGLAAAMATPALACNSSIKPDVSCLAADGTWSVTWSVTSDLQDRTGVITAVDVTPAGAPLTNIVVGPKDNPTIIPAQGDAPLVGVETLKATDTKASIAITAKFKGERKPVTADSPWVNQPTEKCTPPTTPPTSAPTTAPTTTPPTTTPATTPPTTTTTTATPAPSTSGPVLAVTGSSSGPLAGGAVAVVLIGGGAFFLARRRKMKFTA